MSPFFMRQLFIDPTDWVKSDLLETNHDPSRSLLVLLAPTDRVESDLLETRLVLHGFAIMTKTQAYGKIGTLLHRWQEEDFLAKVKNFFTSALALNQEPKELAAAIDELVAQPSGQFEFILSICLVMAMWAARPLNMDSAVYLANFLDSLNNDRIENRLLEMFPIAISTSFPGFKPQGSQTIGELKQLIRQGGLDKSKVALAHNVLVFLSERSNRFL